MSGIEETYFEVAVRFTGGAAGELAAKSALAAINEKLGYHGTVREVSR